MRHQRLSLASAVFANALLGSAICWSQPNNVDWPQFLGPSRNGITSSATISERFDPTSARAMWKVSVSGMAGVSASEGRVYTLTQDQQSQSAIAIDLETGDVLWKQPIADPYRNSQGDGPRSTPTVVDKSVIVFSGDGILASLDSATGEVNWKSDLVDMLGAEVAEYGMSCSPLVVLKTVIVHVGAPDAAVVGVSLENGKVLWKSGNGPAGYSSPITIDFGGQLQVVSLIGNQVLGLEPATGKQLWSFDFVTDYQCNTANPVEVAGKVLLSAGEDHGSVLLNISQSSSGMSADPFWESYGVKSALRSEWQTPLYIDGVIYGFDNVGGAGPVTHLVAVDAATGKQLWRQPRFGKCNAIQVDDKLVMSSMSGELIIATVNRDGYTELSRTTVNGPTRHAPAVVGGYLLLRDQDTVTCLPLESNAN